MTSYEYDDSSSDEEFDLAEEEDIAMLVIVHKNKRLKHGGFVLGREFLQREQLEAQDVGTVFGMLLSQFAIV